MVLLVMVKVAKVIVPRVAPPAGWLRVRLTVEKVVGRFGLARIGIEKVSFDLVWWERQGARGGRVILAGDGRAVGCCIVDRDRHGQVSRPLDVDRRRQAGRMDGEVSGIANAMLTGCAETALENPDVSPLD